MLVGGTHRSELDAAELELSLRCSGMAGEHAGLVSWTGSREGLTNALVIAKVGRKIGSGQP